MTSSTQIDARLMHHVDRSYSGNLRMDRYQVQPVVLTRPVGGMYSVGVSIVCDMCGDRVEYQVLSVAAARLRKAAWIVLTVAGLLVAVAGVAMLATGPGDAGEGLLAVGLLAAVPGGALWATEIGISGPGVRWNSRGHALREHRPAAAKDLPAVTCQRCGHREPFDYGGYHEAKARLARHTCP